ncbi:MAG: GAP family protein, partial [Pseudoxanthomonas sp.]|nr:GAP family protein [Pseudoxanthomonas sp.]
MAMAIALSPFAIIPAIVLLLTPRPRAAGGAFLLGWLLGVGIASGITVATALPASDATGPSAWVAWARLALGATLLVLGIVRWRGRSRAGASPAWLQGIQDATARRALGLGLMLSLANPKVLLLAIAGGLAIG